MACCPQCGGTGVLPKINDAAIEAQLVALQAACRAACAPVTPDLMVQESMAARLLGVAPKTLRNDRSNGRRWRYVKRGRRVLYPLRGLAVWLKTNGEAE